MPRDKTQILRDGSTDLTATESALAFTIPAGSYRRPMAVHVLLPVAAAGTTPTLKVDCKSTDTDEKVESTHTDNVTDVKIPGALAAYPAILTIPVPLSRSVNYEVNLTVGGTTPDFGAVQVWVDQANSTSSVPQT